MKLAVKRSRTSAGVVQVRKSDVKLAKTVLFVIGFLFLVWSPVVILEIFYNFDFSNCTVEQAGIVSVWITGINGVLNPIVYSYRNNEVKKYVFKLFRCKNNIDDGNDLVDQQNLQRLSYNSVGSRVQSEENKEKHLK